MIEAPQLGSATIHEVLGQTGAMTHDMRPVWHGAYLWGPAYTVLAAPGDNLAIHRALDVAPRGSVLVVQTGAFMEGGCFGEIAAVAAQVAGVAGLVCDGAVRDVSRLREIGFPVFSRAVSMKGTSKKYPGVLAEPILCAGVTVAPGDYVLGDEDGVVVVPRARLSDVLAMGEAKERDERRIMDRIRNGEKTMDILGLRERARAQA